MCGRHRKRGRPRKKRAFVVRPWSIAPCPTADDLRAAWAQRRASNKDFIQLLSVLGELSCYLDARLVQKGGFGNIAGRAGGLKTFLEEEAPELAPFYKSISRYARLAYDLKRAFNLYPPLQLSLLHPDLPLPKRNLPFLTNHARKVWRDHLSNLPPRYTAFKAAVDARLAAHPPHFAWGPPLSIEDWQRQEGEWNRRFIIKHALAQIQADHSFYARDWLTFHSPHLYDGPYPDRQWPDEDWL